MGWDEALFGWVARRVEGWVRRPDPARTAAAVDGEPLAVTLRAIAAATAKRDVELRWVDGEGGVDGSAASLPRVMAAVPDAALNAELYRLRACYAGALVARGCVGVGDGADDLRLLVALGDLDRDLARAWPALTPRLDAARAALLLIRRPLLARVAPGARVIEALVAHRLGLDEEAARTAISVDERPLFEAVVRGELSTALEGFRRRRLRTTFAPVPLWGRLLPPRAVVVDAAAVEDARALAREVGTEREGRRRNGPRRARRLDDDGRAENPFTHSFEKVHTAEEHRGGGQKRVDGEDELTSHAAALDELELDEVVLSSERTRSIYRADAAFFGAPVAGEPLVGDGLRYDEWEVARRRYLPDHCRLVVDVPAAGGGGRAWWRAIAARHQRDTRAVREELLSIESARRWRTRQPDGPEIDVDALVDRAAARRAGHEGEARLYVSKRRHGVDLAVFLLVDASLSTDAWVDGRRVFDVEREAFVVWAEAMAGWPAAIGAGAFCSYARRDCRFFVLKGFSESWAPCASRLAALRPDGYTRLGPALRHVTELLARTPARRRLLLLLSDGKPSDFDRYEGRHGIGDVRQALREAHRVGVDLFALAVDPRARGHLPAMLGRQFAVVDGPRALARAAARACAAVAVR